LEGRNRFRIEARFQSAELARRHSLYSGAAAELGFWIRDRLASTVAPAVASATEASEASGVRTSPAAVARRAAAAADESETAGDVTRRHYYTPSELHARV
jgi:hypothetical protein